MATPNLFSVDPLQSVKWPGAPAANQPAKPGAAPAAKPLFGKEVGFGVPIPIDLAFPVANKTVWENKFIRFKFALDGKYEVVRDLSPVIEHSTDVKIDPLKGKVSATVGIKAQVGAGVEASMAYKFNSSFDEMVDLLKTNRKGFRYALLRNLDIVLGKSFKLQTADGKSISEYLKFVGIALVFDPDLCIFSILIPVTFPVYTTDAIAGKVKGRVTANMVLKFGPTKALWARIFRRLGGRTAMRWIVEAMKTMTRELPSEIAAAAEKAGQAATKVMAGEAVVTEATLFESIVSWVGVYSIAVPVSLALTDFMVMVTRSARAAGARDGDLNQFATTYVRWVYGLEIEAHAAGRSMAVKQAAIEQAEKDINERGRDALQRYLEQNFNNGRPVADSFGRVHGSWDVNPIAERMWLQLRKQYN